MQNEIDSLSNSGPPIFSTDPKAIAQYSGTTLIYTLPDISDPDQDQWRIDVDLGSAVFVTFSNKSLNITPSASNVND